MKSAENSKQTSKKSKLPDTEKKKQQTTETTTISPDSSKNAGSDKRFINFEQEQLAIKAKLEHANLVARMKARLKKGEIHDISNRDIQTLDPELQDKLRTGSYRQMLQSTGVVYLEGFSKL